MLKLYDGMSLYHGSYCEVRMPDLAKCAKGKDFGRGFYLTSSKEQAGERTPASIGGSTFTHGYYEEMVSCISGLFGQALKSNDFLHFAVLTGCLRISKESIFGTPSECVGN